ncbi:hypothetical protein Agub_g15286, partial [Astrephomene gubernaculifera]
MAMESSKGKNRNGANAVKAKTFSITDGREVVAKLRTLQLDGVNQQALATSIALFSKQLNSYENLLGVQASLANGLSNGEALADRRAGSSSVLLPGADPKPAHDVNTLPDVFSVADPALDPEHVRALAWHANCPQEAVRKELRAFQKACSDRLSLAAKRIKLSEQDSPATGAKPMPRVPNGFTPSAIRSASSPASIPSGGNTQRHHNNQQHQYKKQQDLPPAGCTVSLDAVHGATDDYAARTAQLAKLETLLSPETGGIRGTPFSTVGMFQQLLLGCCGDWSVRQALLRALCRTAPDVSWRLLQSSRVLEALQGWMQDAVSDRQATMLRLLLHTLGRLPMRRDLLKGSRLEAALEALAGSGGSGGSGSGRGQRTTAGAGAAAGAAATAGGGAAAAGCDGEACAADMRQRFGSAAAAVLEEWRRDPDAAAILRRAGGLAAAAAAETAGAPVRPTTSTTTFSSNGPTSTAPANNTASFPGSRLLLGPRAAAAAAGAMRQEGGSSSGSSSSLARKRLAPSSLLLQRQQQPQQQQDRVGGATGRGVATDGGGSENGSGGVPRPAAVPTAATAAAAVAPVRDMTAKLGDKGGSDGSHAGTQKVGRMGRMQGRK